ncbi:MAG: precorrin-6A reductase [Lachnospiraceae bacterium]|nr:precorrin-6A reductase [Lachnospiraceae bacterium]
MKILIFGGTSEAHLLSDNLTDKGIAHTLSVATEYGEHILKNTSALRKVITGRMDDRAMADCIISEGYDLIIDATHPYATEVTANIIKAVENVNAKRDDNTSSSGVRAVRLIRDEKSSADAGHSDRKSYVYADVSDAANALKDTSGNILITTGSKELHTFTGILGRDDIERLFVRVIPSIESIKLCEAAGIETSHIIAMQGPFDKELNKAIISQYDIKHLVTKDSGRSGGIEGKKDAAYECGIALHIIARPLSDIAMEAKSYEEVLNMIVNVCDTALRGDKITSSETADSKPAGDIHADITLIGMGMGDISGLTAAASDAIKQADIILGSKRLTGICREINIKNKSDAGKEYAAIYKPDEIIEYLGGRISQKETSDKNISVAVVFSGDSGYNSGCNAVYEAIRAEAEKGADVSVRIIPGISSISYLASKIGRPYDDAYICSMHGKGEASIYKAAAHVRTHSDVFALTGGCRDIVTLAKILTDADMGDCMITAAADMSYPGERIITESAERFAAGDMFDKEDKSLYTCHIFNPGPADEAVAAGLSADGFIRGEVPMTKEEVRAVTIDKLKLRSDSRVMDLGCGTGSVSVEIARLIPGGMVYAYDVSEEAVKLTKANVRKHKLPNVIVRCGSVPEVIRENIPEGITHAFIGGNKGRLSDILDMLQEMSGIRVVINAITDRTKEALLSWLSENKVQEYEEISMQVIRSGQVPENAVSIYSFVVL